MLFWDYSKAYLAEAWSGCANSNAFEVMYVVSGEVLNSSCEERSDGTDACTPTVGYPSVGVAVVGLTNNVPVRLTSSSEKLLPVSH